MAPIVDRLRNAIGRATAAACAGDARRIGVSDHGLVVLAMLRNTMPERAVSRAQVGGTLRYVPAERVDAAIAEALSAGALERTAGGDLRLAAPGRTLLEEMYARTASIVCERWDGHDERVTVLNGLVARALEAAAETGGPAFSVLAPPYEPPGAPPPMVLAERLTPLRFHRFDAQVAAWEAAGLTVDEIQALGAGPQRDAIEAETNRRGAAPYAALDPQERLELLGGLGALPN